MLAARQYYIEYGEDANEDALHVVIPTYIPEDRRQDDDSIKVWKKSIMRLYHKLFSGREQHRPSMDRVKADVVAYAKTKWAMTFSRYYDVTKSERDAQGNEVAMKVAVNSTGVYLMTDDRRVTQELAFTDIVAVRTDRWGKVILNFVSGKILEPELILD